MTEYCRLKMVYLSEKCHIGILMTIGYGHSVRTNNIFNDMHPERKPISLQLFTATAIAKICRKLEDRGIQRKKLHWNFHNKFPQSIPLCKSMFLKENNES